MAGVDRELLGQAIDGLYEAAAPELWTEALVRLSVATGGSDSLLLYFPHGNAPWFECTPGLRPVVEAFFADGWQRLNVRSTRGMKLLQRGHNFLTEQMMFEPGELERQPIQREFFDLYGLRSFIGFDLVPGRILASIERGHRPVAGWELSDLNRTAAHFRRIGSLAVARRQGHSSGIIDALSLFNCPAILLDRDSKVIRMKLAAEHILPQAFQLSNGTLMPLHGPSAQAFRAMVAAAVAPGLPHDSPPVPAMAIPRPQARAIIATAAPIGGRGRDFFNDAKAILTLVDPDAGLDIDLSQIRQIFGLTAAQGRLAQSLAAGRDLDESAIALQVTKETARSHLRTIFAKTGVHRRAELTSLLNRAFRLTGR